MQKPSVSIFVIVLVALIYMKGELAINHAYDMMQRYNEGMVPFNINLSDC